MEDQYHEIYLESLFLCEAERMEQIKCQKRTNNERISTPPPPQAARLNANSNSGRKHNKKCAISTRDEQHFFSVR